MDAASHAPKNLSPKDKRDLLTRLLQQKDGLPDPAVGEASYSEFLRRFFALRKVAPEHSSGLLNAAASTLFDLLQQAWDRGMYPYQLPLEGKSGPNVQIGGRSLLMLSSYDYLGLIGHPTVDASTLEAVKKYGTATGGVRLLTGTNDLHHEMERQVARFKGMPAAVSFSNGYLANLGVISALLTQSDRAVIDSHAHRSLEDACKLAGVPIKRFRHNDVDSLRCELQTPPFGHRTLIIADGVYSMDGDICPLPELVALKREFAAYLLVDDSHSFGVLGTQGRGVDEHFGLDARDVDIWTTSLAKAIPSNGGIALVTRDVAVYLQHAASPFIFSAALCPAAVAAITAGLAILRSEPERLATLKRNADILRDGLRDLGFDTGASVTPIIPVMLRDETTTGAVARRLRDLGVLATPVIFPAVPIREARLRLCVTAAHTVEDLEFALGAFRRLRSERPLQIT